MDWRFFEEKDLYWIQEISEDFLKESAWGNRVEINKEKVINYFFAAMNQPNMFGIVSLKEDIPIVRINLQDNWSFMWFLKSEVKWLDYK